MIETIPFEDERIVGFRMSGRVELEDLLPVLEQLDRLLAGQEPLRGYVEIGDVDGVSAEAMLKDLKYAVTHFRALTTRFEKLAVVSDKAWVRGLTRLESLFMPGTDERIFAEADVVEAQAWIRGG